jgi:hypothetical protein
MRAAGCASRSDPTLTSWTPCARYRRLDRAPAGKGSANGDGASHDKTRSKSAPADDYDEADESDAYSDIPY